MSCLTFKFRIQKLSDQLLDSVTAISHLLDQVTTLNQIDHIINVEVVKAANTYKMLGSLLKTSSGQVQNVAEVKLSGDVNNLF